MKSKPPNTKHEAIAEFIGQQLGNDDPVRSAFMIGLLEAVYLGDCDPSRFPDRSEQGAYVQGYRFARG